MRSIAFDPPEYRGRDSAPAVSVLSCPAARPVTPGRLDTANAPHVLALLDRALEGCLSHEFDAMVTAPVQKSVLNDAGIAFTGHTEYLAQRTATPLVVMLLVGGGLRVALATTHLALSEVPRAITRARLEAILRLRPSRRKASRSPGPIPPTLSSRRECSPRATPRWRCSMTRGCRCSSTPRSGAP